MLWMKSILWMCRMAKTMPAHDGNIPGSEGQTANIHSCEYDLGHKYLQLGVVMRLMNQCNVDWVELVPRPQPQSSCRCVSLISHIAARLWQTVSHVQRFFSKSAKKITKFIITIWICLPFQGHLKIMFL